ncbi:hypothetical protein ARU11_00110 [Listeria monocytogenes]|nr:hypothetical protein [Listeria monocytogenes]EAF3670549.1 hypothetical protein [Listeria monocytogenes]
MQGANPCRVYIKPHTPLDNVERVLYLVTEIHSGFDWMKYKVLTNATVEVFRSHNYGYIEQ